MTQSHRPPMLPAAKSISNSGGIMLWMVMQWIMQYYGSRWAELCRRWQIKNNTDKVENCLLGDRPDQLARWFILFMRARGAIPGNNSAEIMRGSSDAHPTSTFIVGCDNRMIYIHRCHHHHQLPQCLNRPSWWCAPRDQYASGVHVEGRTLTCGDGYAMFRASLSLILFPRHDARFHRICPLFTGQEPSWSPFCDQGSDRLFQL